MKNDDSHPRFEDFMATGTTLLDKAKNLILQGNARRLIVRRPNGKSLVEISLTVGLGIAVVLMLLAPMLTALAAMGALFAQFRIEIERNAEDEASDRRDR